MSTTVFKLIEPHVIEKEQWWAINDDYNQKKHLHMTSHMIIKI